jgi:hypothetical protein
VESSERYTPYKPTSDLKDGGDTDLSGALG